MKEEITVKSKFPRTVLNEAKRKGLDLSKCNIHYISIGSPPDDIAVASGSEIKEISDFLILEGVPHEIYIPYHRIVKIECKGKIISQNRTFYP